MREDRANHGAGEQSRSNRRASRNQQKDRTNYFESATKITEPLADSDLCEQFYPENLMRVEFASAGI